MTDPRTPNSKTCTVPGCGREAKLKGMCQAHYRRANRGKPVEGPIRDRTEELVELFGCRVPKKIGDAMKAAAEAQGVSLYEFQRKVNEEWFHRHIELKP